MATTLKTPPPLALTTTLADAYTCPASTSATVMFCQVTNIDGTNNVEVDVTFVDASNANAETYLVYTMVCPADGAMNPIGGRLVLEAGDKIRAKASAAGDAVLTLSVLETT